MNIKKTASNIKPQHRKEMQLIAFCIHTQIHVYPLHLVLGLKQSTEEIICFVQLQAWRLQKEILYFLNISLSRVNPKSGAPPLSCSGALVIQLELHLNRNSSQQNQYVSNLYFYARDLFPSKVLSFDAMFTRTSACPIFTSICARPFSQ